MEYEINEGKSGIAKKDKEESPYAIRIGADTVDVIEIKEKSNE